MLFERCIRDVMMTEVKIPTNQIPEDILKCRQVIACSPNGKQNYVPCSHPQTSSPGLIRSSVSPVSGQLSRPAFVCSKDTSVPNYSFPTTGTFYASVPPSAQYVNLDATRRGSLSPAFDEKDGGPGHTHAQASGATSQKRRKLEVLDDEGIVRVFPLAEARASGQHKSGSRSLADSEIVRIFTEVDSPKLVAAHQAKFLEEVTPEKKHSFFGSSWQRSPVRDKNISSPGDSESWPEQSLSWVRCSSGQWKHPCLDSQSEYPEPKNSCSGDFNNCFRGDAPDNHCSSRTRVSASSPRQATEQHHFETVPPPHVVTPPHAMSTPHAVTTPCSAKAGRVPYQQSLSSVDAEDGDDEVFISTSPGPLSRSQDLVMTSGSSRRSQAHSSDSSSRHSSSSHCSSSSCHSSSSQNLPEFTFGDRQRSRKRLSFQEDSWCQRLDGLTDLLPAGPAVTDSCIQPHNKQATGSCSQEEGVGQSVLAGTEHVGPGRVWKQGSVRASSQQDRDNQAGDVSSSKLVVSGWSQANPPDPATTCNCSKMADSFLQMAELTYRRVSHSLPGLMGSQTFVQELDKTNLVLRESLALVHRIRQLCQHAPLPTPDYNNH